MPFGDYAQASGAAVEDGVYDATVTSAKIVKDDKGLPKKNDNGKCQCDVVFDLGGDVEIRRRYSISFGQNRQNGQWAAFAKFLAVIAGTQPTDPRIELMEPEELVGKRCRVVVSTNERGYNNVDNVLPPEKGSGKPKLVAPRPPETVSEQAVTEDDNWPEDDSEAIPF